MPASSHLAPHAYLRAPARRAAHVSDTVSDGSTVRNWNRPHRPRAREQVADAPVDAGPDAAACAAELCNALDDDCDGVVDEELGSQTCGVGACAATVPICVAGHEHPCSELTAAATETCDGAIDDDCNGAVDDGCTCSNGATTACYGGEPGSEGVGLCHGGSAACGGGTWGTCDGQVVPAAAETCNGDDDDCDGASDEGFGAVSCGTGVCARTIDECVGGVPQTCTPLPGAGDEICDGVGDEDCDGSVDEGCACTNGTSVACYSAPDATSGVGPCHPGTQTCVDGMLDSCRDEVVPTAEICDGVIDDDCDGTADDGCHCVNGSQRSCYTGPGASRGVAPCHDGTETCVAGAWSGCDGEQVPATEACNDADDDCDGSVDNDEADTGCASGVCTGGVCQLPSCFDEVRNGDESDVDCGGGCSADCALGRACAGDGDCANQQCLGSVCTNLNGCNPSNATDQTAVLAINVGFGGATFGQSYNPKCLRVRAGTIVTFVGNLVGHPLMGGVVVNGVRVPAAGGPFVPISNLGTSKAFELSTPGTYPYYCQPHALNGMAGVVYVVP